MSRTSESAFKEAWEAADAEGLKGERVRAGLRAVAARIAKLSNTEGPGPIASGHEVLDWVLEVLRDEDAW